MGFLPLRRPQLRKSTSLDVSIRLPPKPQTSETPSHRIPTLFCSAFAVSHSLDGFLLPKPCRIFHLHAPVGFCFPSPLGRLSDLGPESKVFTTVPFRHSSGYSPSQHRGWVPQRETSSWWCLWRYESNFSPGVRSASLAVRLVLTQVRDSSDSLYFASVQHPEHQGAPLSFLWSGFAPLRSRSLSSPRGFVARSASRLPGFEVNSHPTTPPPLQQTGFWHICCSGAGSPR